MKKLIIVLALLLMASVLLGAAPPQTRQEPVRTAKQIALHEAADILRAAGYTDEDPEIRQLSEAWYAEQEAMSILAKLLSKEAPGVPGAQYCPEWHQIACAQVVVNRTRLPGFPDTVREVVSQRLPSGYYAYNPAYCEDFAGVDRHYYEIAAYVLDGKAEGDVPADLIYQDNVPHGPIWKVSVVKTEWFSSTTYFCR